MAYQNFHVPLPVKVYAQLRKLSRKQKKPATYLVRLAVEKLLEESQKQLVFESVQAYAQKHAGTDADLDPEMEAASAQHVSEED